MLTLIIQNSSWFVRRYINRVMNDDYDYVNIFCMSHNKQSNTATKQHYP